jgi:uncharacterized protein
LIVAYSGGVDSAYLAYAAHQALGERMLAVTALSASYSARDRAEAEKCVAHFRFPHESIATDELANPSYRANQADRCCFCKDELFAKLDALAGSRGFAACLVKTETNGEGPAQPMLIQ